MQVYYFYRHLSEQCIFVSHQPEEGHELEFIWIDSTRDDVINHVKDWQNKIHELSQLSLSEYHVKDILNVEHPCTFDSTEEYNLLILRNWLRQMTRSKILILDWNRRKVLLVWLPRQSVLFLTLIY